MADIGFGMKIGLAQRGRMGTEQRGYWEWGKDVGACICQVFYILEQTVRKILTFRRKGGDIHFCQASYRCCSDSDA